MDLVQAAQPIFEEVYRQKKEKLDKAEAFRIERRNLLAKHTQEQKLLFSKYLKEKSNLQREQKKLLYRMEKEILKNEKAVERLLGIKKFHSERRKFLRGKQENDAKGLGSDNTKR